MTKQYMSEALVSFLLSPACRELTELLESEIPSSDYSSMRPKIKDGMSYELLVSENEGKRFVVRSLRDHAEAAKKHNLKDV